MNMTVDEFNRLTENEKRKLLQQCCGAKAWVDKMLEAELPEDKELLLKQAEDKWYTCTEEDWKEAFLHHPKIGDKEALRKKFSSDVFAGGEQSSVNRASEPTLDALTEGNENYQHKFGFIFIVCATGKSADEMLAILQSRLSNEPQKEIRIAIEEQNKITKLRLQKLFEL
jgi:2-oxo-4-hydroxy-4-carboxy-5-ureidoimidazoline decarboxylase